MLKETDAVYVFLSRVPEEERVGLIWSWGGRLILFGFAVNCLVWWLVVSQLLWPLVMTWLG